MKTQNFKELFRKTSVKVVSAALAVALVAGGVWMYDSQNQVPELVTYVDTEGSIEIAEEEVPLAAPKVTQSTKTKKKTKKIKMKKAAKKTYKKTSKAKKKIKTKRTTTKNSKTTTKTVESTQVMNQYKKGSKINTQVTITKTTVTKTVLSTAAKDTPSAETTSGSAKETVAATNNLQANGSISVEKAAPKLNSRVVNAFNKLGFRIQINSGVAYSGVCDTRTRTITLKRLNDTVYHELGHFVAFAAGNADTSSAFREVYNNEKSRYNEYNKGYVLSSSAEYFAESFKNYTLNPAALKASRPQTYAAIEDALAKITDSQLSRILNVYGTVWNK